MSCSWHRDFVEKSDLRTVGMSRRAHESALEWADLVDPFCDLSEEDMTTSGVHVVGRFRVCGGISC